MNYVFLKLVGVLSQHHFPELFSCSYCLLFMSHIAAYVFPWNSSCMKCLSMPGMSHPSMHIHPPTVTDTDGRCRALDPAPEPNCSRAPRASNEVRTPGDSEKEEELRCF